MSFRNSLSSAHNLMSIMQHNNNHHNRHGVQMDLEQEQHQQHLLQQQHQQQFGFRSAFPGSAPSPYIPSTAVYQERPGTSSSGNYSSHTMDMGTNVTLDDLVRNTVGGQVGGKGNNRKQQGQWKTRGPVPQKMKPMTAPPSRKKKIQGGRPESEYQVFIPKKSLQCQIFNSKISCKGCGQEFAATIVSKGSSFGEPQYFIHCGKECERYKQLGTIKRCEECAVIFITSQAERRHHGDVHMRKKPCKPDWMTDRIYKMRVGIRCNTKINCSACGKFFGAQSSAGKISYSLEYLIHCIQECEAYKRLDLMQECPTCHCKFLNKLSLSQHQSAKGKGTECTIPAKHPPKVKGTIYGGNPTVEVLIP